MINKDGIMMLDEKIYISSMNAYEAEKYRVLRNRDDNRQMFFDDSVISMEQQRSWFEKYLEKPDEYMFSIYDRESGAFVGGIGIYTNDRDETEIGRIIIDRMICGGKGYGALAIRLLVDFMRQSELKSLVAYIFTNNIASQRSFEKAGFRITDTLEDKIRYQMDI